MTTIRGTVALLIAWQFGASALAQGPELGAELTSPASDVRPRVVAVDPELVELRARERSERVPPTDAPRVSQVGFGRSLGHAWAGLAIGSGVGFGIGAGIGYEIACTSEACIWAMLGIGGLGAAAGAPLGAGLATWGFGELSSGTGNVFAALGGAYLGAGLGVGLGFLLVPLSPLVGLSLAAAVGMVTTTLGAAAGYQLSSSGGRPTQRASAGLIVVPTISGPERGEGVVVGAAGIF